MRLFVTVLVLASCMFAQAQDLMLKGRIITEDLEVLPEATINNQNNELLGVTDIEGNFDISNPKEVSKLKICSVGMETTVIELSGDCDFLEIIVIGKYCEERERYNDTRYFSA